MTIALYPGSFDPFHRGHLDTVEQIVAAFDEVVVATMHNPSKSGLLDPARRIELIERSTSHLADVRVIGHEGLTVDAARSVGADVVVRAMIRGVTDELTMAATNEALAGIETYFVTPHPDVAPISSTLVRALLAAERFDQIAAWVPPAVLEGLAGAAR